MSHQNVDPDLHTVRVNMSNVPQRDPYGPVQHAAGSVSPDNYNKEYQQSGPGTSKRSIRSDVVYVNSAYVGSVNSVNNITPPRYEPPTRYMDECFSVSHETQSHGSSVIREQYWACSRWPFTQRALAIAVGVLLGAVVSLIITLTLKRDDADIRTIFQVRLAPD